MRNHRTSRNIDVELARNGEPVNGAARSPGRTEADSARLQRTLRSAEPQTAVAAAARELTERRRGEQARRREQMLQSLQEPGGGHWKLELPVEAGVIVGVEVERAESTLVAHAVHDLHGLTPWLGIASCGIPAEYLTLVSELAWAEVDGRLRCPHCDSAGLSSS